LIEEGPAPGVDPAIRDAVCESAAEFILTAKYSGAATVEFLMNEKQEFFMLEVNTRVQVEHPVTEMITGVDIVKESIRVAAGEPLSWTQDEIQLNGHAIECRINAEDPSQNFMPQPGTIEVWRPAGGPGVRVETHVVPGYRIPPNYDSMIGKLIVHGRNREEATARMRCALSEFQVGPIATTIPLHQRLLNHHAFVSASFDINWVEHLLDE
jgi:acetyl-CoA carboxylase biotin carboxylase subunit